MKRTSLTLHTLNIILKLLKNLTVVYKKLIPSTSQIKEDYMSPERKEAYNTKRRKMAFYIVENEKLNEDVPPTVSSVIGLDKELEAAFFAARRPPLEKHEKPAMEAGIVVNRQIISNKKEKKPVKVPTLQRNGLHCPTLPSQWKNNLDIRVPKAHFGHFSPTRK